jgi:hypothetical protein
LPDALVTSLDTTIIQVLEIRAVLLAGSGRAPEAARSARNALMVREYARGDPLQKIGERHGVSHQRVRHLMLICGACRVPVPPRRCSVCPEPVEAHGLCRFHYYRLRTYGDPEFVPRRGVNADHGTSSRYQGVGEAPLPVALIPVAGRPGLVRTGLGSSAAGTERAAGRAAPDGLASRRPGDA